MTLSNIASVANVVSSAAVLISLVYLSLQLRQGSRPVGERAQAMAAGAQSSIGVG